MAKFVAIGLLAVLIGCQSTTTTTEAKGIPTKCAGCAMEMKCSDMVIKCKCGADVKCCDMTLKCKGCGNEQQCAGNPKCGKCGAEMSCDMMISKCPKCGSDTCCSKPMCKTCAVK